MHENVIFFCSIVQSSNHPIRPLNSDHVTVAVIQVSDNHGLKAVAPVFI